MTAKPIEDLRAKMKPEVLAESERLLEDLLNGISEDNRHPETDWGPPVGKEVW